MCRVVYVIRYVCPSDVYICGVLYVVSIARCGIIKICGVVVCVYNSVLLQVHLVL